MSGEVPVTLRAACAGEGQVLSDLAMRSKAYWGYPAQFLEACRAELTVTEAQLVAPEWLFAVAQAGQAIAGFCALHRPAAVACDLDALFVAPEWMGRGIGRRLLCHAIDQAARWGIARLTVVSDPHAAGFYRAMGARATGWCASQSVPGRSLPTFAIEVVARPG